MAEIILITGGCRSGKSQYAEKLTTESEGEKLYIATAPVLDEEMKERISRHKQNRADAGWETIEEELDLAGVFSANTHYNTILVDCLTLWINNLLYAAEQNNSALTEDIISRKVIDILTVIKPLSSRIIFVTNEVGMGVVPENNLARLFRDLSGRCSQIISQNANNVILMSCGLPLILK